MKKRSVIPVALALFLALWVGPAVLTAHDDGVPDSAEGIRPLLLGAQIPEVQYRRADGTSFDLRQAVAEKPTILIYYRGGW